MRPCARACEPNVLEHAHIQVVVPRVHRSEPLGDFAAVLAQIVVLLDERVELRPLLSWRAVTV
jgi:hypothetical protein